ncbi:C39 family peptidase [Filifactor alocis]|uniref:C39 family peptidase n=1 Tax=Filifactor alocis TaxID=143361 RepID=UPI0028D87123|nr:C39 family peptidase [Filifactor alocis]
MKMIRNIMLFAPVGIFLIVILAASGGGSTASTEPVSIVASKKKIEQYAQYATDLGVPWDIVLLSDVLNAEKAGQKGVESINPVYTTLEFLRANVEVEHYEVVGTETHTDSEGNTYEVDKYDWVYNRTDEYVAKNDILSYIGLTESDNPDLTPQNLIDRLNQKASDDSTDEWRYKASFLVNTDYRSVLSNYIKLSSEQVDNVIKLYTSEYMNSWLPEDLKNRINNMMNDMGLNQENNISVRRSYEGITFTDTDTPVVYYNQADSRWGSQMYVSKTIANTGCGPTALAIVVSTLTGTAYDPPAICEWARTGNYYVHGKGSVHSLIPDGARHFGLQVSGCSYTEGQRIVDALSSGSLVVAIMSKGHFTTGGHFIVLRGVTADGKILVADPGSTARSQQKWDLSIILNEANKGASAGGPFWIISK